MHSCHRRCRFASCLPVTYDLAILLVVTVSYIRATAENSHCSVVTIFGLKTADCRNLNLKSVHRNMPADTKVLRFNDNQLTFLGLDAFHSYLALQELHLARNRIEIIAPDAFRGLDNLQLLDLEGNKLKLIPSQSFRHIRSLRMLSLKSNAVTYIAAGAFDHLVNLEKLDLENCWLNRVHQAAFTGLSRLIELNVINNELTGLSADMEPLLPKTITILRLHRNPWVCDCQLRWLRRYVSSPGGSSSSSNNIDGELSLSTQPAINWDFAAHNTPVCDGPELLHGISWRHLVADQFACPPTQIVSNSSSTSVELVSGTNASIDCVIEADPDPTIQWMKGTSFVAAELITTQRNVNVLSGQRQTTSMRVHSTLHLHSVTVDDAGDYKCVAVNPAGRSEVTYKVWVYTTHPVASGKKRENANDGDDEYNGNRITPSGMEVVFGIVVGLALLVALLFACAVWIVSKKRSVLSLETSHERKQNVNGNNYITNLSSSSAMTKHVTSNQKSAGGEPPSVHDAGLRDAEQMEHLPSVDNGSDDRHLDDDKNSVDGRRTNADETKHMALAEIAERVTNVDSSALNNSPPTPDSPASTSETNNKSDDIGDVGYDAPGNEFKMKIFASACDDITSSTAVTTPEAGIQASREPPQSKVSETHTGFKQPTFANSVQLQLSPRLRTSAASVASKGRRSSVTGYDFTTGRHSVVMATSSSSSHCTNPVCQKDRYDVTGACTHRYVTTTAAVDCLKSRQNSIENLQQAPPSSPSASVFRRSQMYNYATLPHGMANDLYTRSGSLNVRSHAMASARTNESQQAVHTGIQLHNANRPTTYSAGHVTNKLSGSSGALDVPTCAMTSSTLSPLPPHSLKLPNSVPSSSGFQSTSLHDILNSPFGSIQANGFKNKSVMAVAVTADGSLRLRPGEQDEFGTVV